MSRFQWRGIDWHGNAVSGTCNAESAHLLRWVLRQHGIEPIAVHLQLWPAPTGSRQATKPSRQAATFRRLATLLETGTTIDRALQIICAQEKNLHLRDSLRHARRSVEHGNSLTASFAAALPALNSTHKALLQAGERSGDMIGALQGIATELERQAELLSQLRRSITYPAIVGCAAVSLIAMLLLLIVPRFEAAFAHSNAPLPLPTRAVMGVAEGFAAALPYLGGLLSLGAVATWLYRRRATPGKTLYDLLSHLPVTGPVIRDATLNRWCGTLARLLSAGIPLLDALPVASRTSKCAATFERLLCLERTIRAGERFAPALRSCLPEADRAAQLVAIGEESGRLAEMLDHAAHDHKTQLERRIQSFTALIEPTLIILMGLVTAAIIAALYLPIFKLGTTVGNL